MQSKEFLSTGFVFALFVASSVHAEPANVVSKCDQLAASSLDNTRPADVQGVSYAELDPAKAVDACKEAATASTDRRMQFQYARALQKAGSLSEAVKWYRLSADQHFSLSQNNLATILADGAENLPSDKDEAFRLMSSAADSGLTTAKQNLGMYFRDGTGTAVDFDKAVHWFEAAANDGLADSHRFAAQLLDAGDKTHPSDPERAAGHWRVLAQQGNNEARVKIGLGIRDGRIRTVNANEMVEMLTAAADAKSLEAALALGRIFSEGKNGYETDYTKSLKYGYTVYDVSRTAASGSDEAWPVYQVNAADIISKSTDHGVDPRDKEEFLQIKTDLHPKSMKKFTIPIDCQGTSSTLDVYVWDWSRDTSPVEGQLNWLNARGCSAPTDVRVRFTDVFNRAKSQHISFLDLAVKELAKNDSPEPQASAKATAAESVENMIANGNQALDQEDFSSAFQWFRKAAEAGNTIAMNIVADFLDDGKGVKKDSEEAIKWYRKSAELGDTSAMLLLGIKLSEGSGIRKDVVQATLWIKKAAEGGLPLGMTTFADRLSSGKGVPKDRAQAVQWLRKAALLGEPVAMLNLGVALDNGEGTSKNTTEANFWYRKSAEAGQKQAMSNLLLNLIKGYGVDKDAPETIAESAKWLHKLAELGDPIAKKSISEYRYRNSADAGDVNAMINLGVLLVDDEAVADAMPARRREMERNLTEATQWFRKAANADDRLGMYYLGRSYQRGYGVSKDNKQANIWFLKSAEKGLISSMLLYAYNLQRGIGVAKDPAQATAWFRKAAEAGSGYGMFGLALNLAVGSGVTKNYAEALMWAKKSSENGTKGADDLARQIERDMKQAKSSQ